MEYAVASARLLAPLFRVCETIYSTIERSKSFSGRFSVEKRFLEAEYAVFVALGRIRHDQLLEPLDDHETARMMGIIRLLQNAKDIMEDSEKLIQEVVKRSQPPRKLVKRRPVASSTVAPATPISNNDGRGSLQLPDQSDGWTLPTQSGADDGVSEPEVALAGERQTETSANTSISEFSGDSKAPGTAVKKPSRFRVKERWNGFLHRNKSKDARVREQTPPLTSGSSTPHRSIADVVPSSSSGPPAAAQTLAQRAERVADQALVVSISPPKEPKTIHPDRGGEEALIEEIKGSAERLKEFHLAFKENNKKLERLLRLKPDTGMAASTSAVATEQTSTLVQKMTTTQVALQRLHHSIRCMNPPGSQRRVTLKLAVDFEKEIESSRDRLDHLKLRARGDYFYFGLKIHDRDSDLEGMQATEYVAETKIVYDNQEKKQLSLLSNDSKALMLKKAANLPAKPEPGQKFMAWGVVLYENQADYARDHHKFFRNDTEVWTTVETLQTLMRPDGAPRHMKLWQRVELMKLAVAAQLYFTDAKSKKLICRPITLSRFAYYAIDPKAPRWQGNNPLILKPHLDIDFGRRNEDVPEYPLPPVTELGIVLLQIAGCVLLDVDTESDQQREAKDWADQQFEQLNSRALIPLVRIAKDCVEFDPANPRGIEFLANKFTRLSELGATKYSRFSAAGQTVP